MKASALPSSLPQAGFLLSVLVFSSGCEIAAKRPIPWDHWRPTFPEVYNQSLAEKEAKIWDYLFRRHMSPEGVLIFQRPNTPFDPDADDAYANLSDTPIWQGSFVAALACKLHVTQSDEVRRKLLLALDGLTVLHDVTGKSGLFARGIFPKGRTIPREAVDGEWRDAPAPYDHYRFRGDVSRDQYCGVLFGYAAVTSLLDLHVDRGDPEIRSRIAPIARAVADHFWENDLRIVDTDGEATQHGDLRPYVGIIPIGINAGLVLGFHHLALRLTGEDRFRERLEIMHERLDHEALRILKFGIFGETNHNNDNMAMMGLYALTRLDTDPRRHERYRVFLKRLWRWIQYEGNVFWNMVYASQHPLTTQARRDVSENLRLYPDDHRVFNPDWRGHPLTDPAFFPDRFGRPKNRTALPVHVRKRGGDFIWKNCPYALVDRAFPEDGSISASGFDYLLAYWMTRVYLGDPDRRPLSPK